MRRKSDLPSKICVACGRPFAWRRKWKASWEEVRFCSDRCRSQRGAEKMKGKTESIPLGRAVR